ncbi:MAG TPA: dienelactone hydrolase family protein [Planctomycetota bacterium]|nr:dienelactone hydrolase family protein [Planctomycetota bacterium]
MRAMQRAIGFGVALGLACGALAGAPADAPRKLKSDPKQEYHLYLPKKHDPKQEYYLFVAVHAANGSGAGALGLNKLADEGHCIVLAPTFKGDFQNPAKGSGDKLKAILREVAGECKVQPKVFLVGFAEGAAFAYRFAADNPSLVLGCAAHSADKWDAPDPKARQVPFLVTCGQDDKKPNRIGEARKFAQALKGKKFEVQTNWPKGVGHAFSPQARDKTKEFFLTLTTGMNAWERQKATATLAKATAALKENKYAEAALAARELLELKPNAEYIGKANALLQQVYDAGKAKLAQVEEQAKSDPAAAAEALQALHEQFLGTPVAEAAAARLKSLEEAVKAAAERDAGEAEAPAEASPAAKMKAQCRRWLMLANNYIANGRTGEARLALHKIIEAYPDSVFAEQAKAKLDALR